MSERRSAPQTAATKAPPRRPRMEGDNMGPIATIRRDWRQFWFENVSPTPVALVRIIMGILVLLCCYQLWPDRFAWFSDRGVMTTDVAMQFDHNTAWPPHLVQLLNYAPDWWINTFFILLSIAAICMSVGFCTRTAIVLVWCGLYSINSRDLINNNTGYDAMIRCVTVYLFFANSGGACSVDRLIRVWRGKESPSHVPLMAIWPQRLIQIQVSVVYICTFCSKATGDLWQNGTAAYFPYMIPDLHKLTIPLIDGNHMWAINIMTYYAEAIELALGALVWNRRLMPYVLFGGVLLHVGIEYSINIPIFAEAMLGSYIAFFCQQDLLNFTKWCAARFHVTELRVVYDGECGCCRSIKLVLERFDIFRRVRFLDQHNPEDLKLAPEVTMAEAETAAVAVNPRGRKYLGFYAFRQIVRRTPGLWILLPFLYLIPWPFKMLVARTSKNRMGLPVAPAVRMLRGKADLQLAKR
jgi:predicted DCC family thiol-disulfide oxidoreductase YuxK